jgi:RNA polymerase sigma factor (sigma-70 family)
MGDSAYAATDRERLFASLADLRPELHRYCARLTGSVFDGEDLVQDALLEALTSAPTAEPSRVRAWAFRLAHNRAIDRWRSYDRRMREAFEDARDVADPLPSADDVLAKEEAARAAVARFVELPPLQRSCVILKDVLDHSLDDIATLLAISVSAVQAALFRARRALRDQPRRDDAVAPSPSPTFARYAALFSAHDWDGVRALLADDVRVDVVGRFTKRGRAEVGGYFGNYASLPSWCGAAAMLEGREVIAVFRHGAPQPASVIAIDLAGDRVVGIRDYFHVPYLLEEATVISHPTASGDAVPWSRYWNTAKSPMRSKRSV